MSDVSELIPIQRIQQHVYCKRLFYLEYVQAQFETNRFVKEGEYVHRRVDQEKGDLSNIDSSEGNLENNNARSISISSSSLGLTGIADLIEQTDDETVLVEFKRGKPQRDGTAWETHQVQVCALVLVLRDNGYQCERAQIYYAASKQRIDVPISDALIDRTLEENKEMRHTAELAKIPPPLYASPKCPGCSLVGICMPDEVNLHNGVSEQQPRKLVPRKSAARPIYITEVGSKVSFRKGRVVVSKQEEELQQARLIDVSQINLYGNVQISSQMMRRAFDKEIPVCWFSYGGWFQGIATGMPSKHVDLRRRQVAISAQSGLPIAKEMIKGKIRNSRTFLMRNARIEIEEEKAQLKHLANSVDDADSLTSLLGTEGAAARTYFGAFSKMIRDDALGTFDFNGRNRRPPKDPINCLLSYCYALLVKDLTATVIGIGFDAYLGVLHQPRYGRPALSLDLAEEFRPVIAESVALNMVNNGEIGSKHFIHRAGSVALTKDGRKAVLESYERRLETEITHPTYQYRVTYRRAFELQARVLAAHFLGDIPGYVPLMTR